MDHAESATITVLMARNHGDWLRRACEILGLLPACAGGELVFVDQRTVERAAHVRRQQQMPSLPNVAKERDHRKRRNDRTPQAPLALVTWDSAAKRLHDDEPAFFPRRRRVVNTNATRLQVSRIFDARRVSNPRATYYKPVAAREYTGEYHSNEGVRP
jgi:hypothetical protein